MNELLHMYSRVFKRHPFFLVLTLFFYSAFLVWFLFRTELYDAWVNIQEGNVYKVQLTKLKEELRTRDQILNTLTTRSKTASFIKDFKFEEHWESEENQVEVDRLLEYADFALRKNDPSRAESLYKESLSIQETLSANYELASLYYFEGHLEKAIGGWEKFGEIDKSDTYPVVSLYLGIAYHEIGNEMLSLKNLEHYVSKLTKKSARK